MACLHRCRSCGSWYPAEDLHEDDETGPVCQDCQNGVCVECKMIDSLEGLPFCDLCSRRHGYRHFLDLVGMLVTLQLPDRVFEGVFLGVEVELGQAILVVDTEDGEMAFAVEDVIALHDAH